MLQHTNLIVEVCLNLVLEFQTQSTSEVAAAYIGSPATAGAGGHADVLSKAGGASAAAAAVAAAAAASAASATMNHAARQRALFVADPVFQRDAHRAAIESLDECARLNGDAVFARLMASCEARTLQQLRAPPDAIAVTRSFR